MSEPLTDAQVIEILARREGRSEILFVPNYLTSRDALSRVLAKLSEEEWIKLMTKLYFSSDWEKEADRAMDNTFGRYLLTLPPATLARALAAVIQ